MKNNEPKFIGHSQSSLNRKIHWNAGLLQEARTISLNNLNLHLKETGRKKKKKLSEYKKGHNTIQSWNK